MGECPKSWYTAREIAAWLDREGWPVYPTDLARESIPKFCAEHFQRALEKGWQMRDTAHDGCGHEAELVELKARLSSLEKRGYYVDLLGQRHECAALQSLSARDVIAQQMYEWLQTVHPEDFEYGEDADKAEELVAAFEKAGTP